MQRNASKHIKHAVSLLTFEKENIPRSSIISPHQNNILIMLHDLYNPTTSNALRASLFWQRCLFYFNGARPWFVSCLLWQRLCAFSFCVDTSFKPAKNKEQLGQQNQTYILISTQLSGCSTQSRDAYCLSVSFSFKASYFFNAIKDSSFTLQWHGTRWLCMVSILILDYGHIGLKWYINNDSL